MQNSNPLHTTHLTASPRLVPASPRKSQEPEVQQQENGTPPPGKRPASDQVPATGTRSADHVTRRLSSFDPHSDEFEPFETADVLIAYADNNNQLIRFNLILAEAEARVGNYERAAELTAIALGRLEGEISPYSSDPDGPDWEFYKPRGGVSL